MLSRSKTWFLISFLVFFTAGTLLAQLGKRPFPGRYADHYMPDDEEIIATYQRSVVKTADGLYVSWTYFPETGQIMRLDQYADTWLRPEYWPDGNRLEEGFYFGGEKEGLWNHFTSSGPLAQTKQYHQGSPANAKMGCRNN